MARILISLLIGGVLYGCGAPSTPSSGAIPRLEPKEQASATDNAERKPATPQEVAASFDLPEYPGAEMIETFRLVSPNYSPDEARFELARRSSDPPAKVVKFYEQKLSATAAGEPGHQEILGRTPRGNFVRVHIDADGTGSKFTLRVISYTK